MSVKRDILDLASNNSLTTRSPNKNPKARTKFDDYRMLQTGNQSPALTERHAG